MRLWQKNVFPLCFFYIRDTPATYKSHEEYMVPYGNVPIWRQYNHPLTLTGGKRSKIHISRQLSVALPPGRHLAWDLPLYIYCIPKKSPDSKIH
ncbi:hypothetical protein NA56DRAFT_376517 [Hyaloscypha hepaticicola]|uniref:Uncharacterized protein n=1 Tax=Hyaloscypha hepaticicola TaxID=2082293 RepID=A0A2J6PK19_9HELO|nr:hypothetical protein NA56DRAFT_376517 [Hyaloscypha hepaticicola]